MDVLGTLINAASVAAGSIAGLLLKRRLPRRGEEIVFNTVGLFTAYLGLTMALRAESPVSLVLGLVAGALAGELCKLEEALEGMGERLRRVSGCGSGFTEGLITAFLTYCVGPMTVIGSLRDGMGDPSILLAKSVMDGAVSVAYAAAMGVGVLFSAIPLLLFQGSLALIGALAGAVLPSRAVADMTGTGGVLLLGLSLNLLKLKKVRVGNMLPALVLVPLISQLLGC